jgi:hypothetical protein
VPIGQELARANIDAAMQGLAKELYEANVRLMRLKEWRDATPIADVEALGYSPDEANDVYSLIDIVSAWRTALVEGGTISAGDAQIAERLLNAAFAFGFVGGVQPPPPLG